MDTIFSPGSDAIYGIHGRCQIVGIEEKQLGGQSISFYKVELAKPPIGKSKKSEAAIWIPVKNARQMGLRTSGTVNEAQSAMRVLESHEYYFALNENMKNVTHAVEELTRNEGIVGLAKAYSYLYVRTSREASPTGELTRLFENTERMLFRELAEVLNQSQKDLENQISRVVRQKLKLDH